MFFGNICELFGTLRGENVRCGSNASFLKRSKVFKILTIIFCKFCKSCRECWCYYNNFFKKRESSGSGGLFGKSVVSCHEACQNDPLNNQKYQKFPFQMFSVIFDSKYLKVGEIKVSKRSRRYNKVRNTFLGVGKNFRLLMQSCCFFLPTFS